MFLSKCIKGWQEENGGYTSYLEREEDEEVTNYIIYLFNDVIVLITLSSQKITQHFRRNVVIYLYR